MAFALMLLSWRITGYDTSNPGNCTELNSDSRSEAASQLQVLLFALLDCCFANASSLTHSGTEQAPSMPQAENKDEKTWPLSLSVIVFNFFSPFKYWLSYQLHKIFLSDAVSDFTAFILPKHNSNWGVHQLCCPSSAAKWQSVLLKLT